jgi:metal-sulfur cluster biosynthetic enzyme
MATDTDIREALRHVMDPEIGVNIVDLGLVYRIDLAGSQARVEMTMTSPACPLADYMKALVVSAIQERVPGITDVDVAIGWDPPWDPDMMSEDAKRQLGAGDR